MSWELFAVWIPWSILLTGLAWWLGRRHGTERERMRAENLCHRATLKRFSGSVRWVWNAVSTGQKELMPHDEFFVDDQDARKSQ